jgi:uncharacterized protein (DUF362 family)
MPRVSLIKGHGRRANAEKALALISAEIKKGLASRQPVIKPNFVSSTIQLPSSHVDQIRGILDFLSGFYQDKIIIAEAACYDTMEAYRNFGYLRLLDDYNVELVDLNAGHSEIIPITSSDKQKIGVRVSSLLLDEGNYVVSAARMKTHDTVVVTLSIKNVAVGSIIGGDKKAVHQGVRQTNLNIAELAGHVWPDLAMIDGFEGMQGDGPTGGDPVLLNVAIAGTDALAADRVACEVMGVDFHSVGYLHFCAEWGLGEADLNKIDVLGEKVKDCVRPFKLHRSVKEQYAWKAQELRLRFGGH